MIRKNFLFYLPFLLYLTIATAFADIQENLINKLKTTETLSFNFIQKIAEKEEVGKCYIKYPLLMKCNYQNLKQKTIISNSKTMVIIKKKYKKIYYYPIKSTPLFTILNKEKILTILKNNQPIQRNDDIIEFELVGKKLERLKILKIHKKL